LIDRTFEFRDGLVVIIKRILCGFPGGPRSLRCTSLGAGLHGSESAHHRLLIDAHIQISRRAEMSMSEYLLRDLDVPGCVDDSLSQCVTEEMWMNHYTRFTRLRAEELRIAKDLDLQIHKQSNNQEALQVLMTS
jgi:hypothetical protein